MRFTMEPRSRIALYSLLTAASLVLGGCGGGGSSSGSNSGGSTTPVENSQTIEVNFGPANNYTNGLFTDVTICVPGTTNCQTVSNVLVDTGSIGLRLLSSAVTLQLPAVTDNSSNGLQECSQFADGSFVWGPVVEADIQMAGEKGSSVPIQLISSSPQFPVPNSCTGSGGQDENTVQSLGANGILGIGLFQQDCGSACAATSSVPALYYLCSNAGCNSASVPLQFQLQNPVSTFSQDNNGFLISLPSIPADGAASVSGSLIFGVGTQSDNGLGNAQVYTTDANGNFHVIYNNTDFNNSFIDSGSNALYFLDAATLGILDCPDNAGFYCPATTQSYTVKTAGLNGISNSVTFNIANADSLFIANGGNNSAFDDLGGDTGTDISTDYFDFGVPFFYGRNVFVGIENQTGPNGVVGPYWAY